MSLKHLMIVVPILIPGLSFAQTVPVCTDAAVSVSNGWGWENGGTCAAACNDPDGDGFGWNGSASCVVSAGNSVSTGSAQAGNNQNSAAAICVDPNGDGWGWDGTQSCRVGDVPASAVINTGAVCVDPNGDGWGWDGTQSCRVGVTPDTSNSSPASAGAGAATNAVCVDPNGDGWGWDGTASCRVTPEPDDQAGVIVQAESTGQAGVIGQPRYTLRSDYGDTSNLAVMVDDVFAVWWDPAFDREVDASAILAQTTRFARTMRGYGLQNPPHTTAGEYFNIYLHHGNNDLFPSNWGRQLYPDSQGRDFLTLQHSIDASHANTLNHHLVHAFQSSANSSGYAGAFGVWYREASAFWQVGQALGSDAGAWFYASVVKTNPHLALWHTQDNRNATDPDNWQSFYHAYSLSSFLGYITDNTWMGGNEILGAYNSNIEVTPQEYLSTRLGRQRLRELFTSWAAIISGGRSFLTPVQQTVADTAVADNASAGGRNEFAISLGSDSTGIFSPPASLTPRGWAYNVIRIQNNGAKTYNFTLNGNALGSEGGQSHFDGRVVSVSPSGYSYQSFGMRDAINGSASVSVDNTTTEVLLVITATPDSFTGNQTYGYSVTID